MATTKPAFRRGAEEAEKATPQGGGGDYSWFQQKENDDGIVIRYLTDSDEWITVDQHYAPTRSKPKDWPEGSKWPKGMSAVCRNDEALREMYGDCYICENMSDPEDEDEPNKAKPRTWALAAEREEVRENGKVIGVQDVLVDGPDGDKVPKILIVNQAYSNFFTNAQAFAGRYGTVLDRDYFITRSGKNNSTNYPHVPLDPVDLDLGDGETTPLDLREEAIREYYYAGRESLEDVVMGKASDRFYALFFDETKKQPAIKSNKDDDESTDSDSEDEGTEPAPKSEDKPESNGGPAKPDPERLAAIRARVTNKG